MADPKPTPPPAPAPDDGELCPRCGVRRATTWTAKGLSCTSCSKGD